MVKPDKGNIWVNDQLINGDPTYRNIIGYMPQIGRYPDNMKIGQLFQMLQNIRSIPVQKLDKELVRKFELDALLIPGQFLRHQCPAAEDVCAKIGPAPSPLGAEAVEYLDHRLIKGAAHAAYPDPFLSFHACPSPHFHAHPAPGVGAV